MDRLKKFISVTTSIATVVVLSGVLSVAPAYALSNEAVVEDVTGTSPRIAADGESERVALGVNLSRTDNSDTVQLNAMKVRLTSDDTANVAAVSNIETVRIYQDSSLSGTNGVFDENDALLKEVTRGTTARTTTVDAVVVGANTDIDLTAEADLDHQDWIKIGTGATSEIVQISCTDTTPADNVCDDGTVDFTATYAHSAGATVQEVTAPISANAGNGFVAVSGGEIVVELGDPGNTTVGSDLGYDIPKTDSGAEAGNDLFVVLVTKDGTSSQTVKAQVFTSGDVEYLNNTGTAAVVTPAISSAAGTTSGKTKSLTFGADGVAPTITKVETYDNTADGKVDRVKVYFSESMASGVTDTGNFTNASSSGTPHRIEAGANDINLNTTGTWSTTTNLNDTFTIDFTSTTWTNETQSTGDSWTVVYDKDLESANKFKDATGEELGDASVTTTDMAKPYLVSAKVKDTNGNQKADSLEVTFSESIDSSSTSSGLALKETAVGTSTHTYTLGSSVSLKQSTGSNSNSNDTVVVSITERAENDVTGTFTVDYTSGSTVKDPAGNEASSRTGVSATVDVAPVVTRVEFQDNCTGVDTDDNGTNDWDCSTGGANGKLDTVKITFSRSVDTDYSAGGAVSDWTVGGYSSLGVPTASANPSGANTVDGTTTLYMRFAEKTFDTGTAPDLTYSKASGDSANVCVANGDNDCQPTTDSDVALENVASGDVTEEDAAGPVLRTATLYDTNGDGIWSSGETLQLLFSENVDAGSVTGSWANDTYTDWTFSALAAAESPNSGTVSVSGKVVILTAGVSATSTFATDVTPTSNEVKDAAGNSATTTVTASVNPTSAPSVNRVETRDLNGNGVVDALSVEFAGLVDVSTLVASDWAVARSSNFTTNSEGSFSNSTEVTPDLTVTSVVTENGGNDTRVLVKFAEQNENTGLRPQVKYVQGSAKDLAGNLISSFNQGSDNAKFATSNSTNAAAYDGAAPQVVHKLLRDRNNNGKYDQLVLVFSEAMTTSTTSTTGWSVSGHNVAASGSWSSNNAGVYDAYTFASSNNVFSADILEGSAPTSVPSVTYASTGAFKDANSLPLASVSAGNEMSEINVSGGGSADLSMLSDGDLVSVDGDFDIYIYKMVGTKNFKRLILNPEIFNSYGHLSWSNVKTVTQAQLDAMTLSDMILEDGGTKVYKVSSAAGADTGTKQWLNMSASAFESCGYDWDSLYMVNSTEVSDSFYPVGADITSC